MKRTIVILSLLFLAFFVKAEPISNLPLANAFYNTILTNVLSGVGTTNPIVGTNYIGNDLYHTWYLTTTNLNGGTCAIAFSGDQTNWVNWGTIANSIGTNSVSTNAVFKQLFVRYTFSGSNLLGSLTYVGGR